MLEGGEDVLGVGADAVVGVGFGEGDGVGNVSVRAAGSLYDEGGGDGETPGVVALIAVDEGDVDEDAAVVQAEVVGYGVRDAELCGQSRAGVGEDGEGEAVVLDGEVVLADQLRRDGDEECAALADLRVELLPDFELGHAVGAPAATEELDDDGSDSEEVVGLDDLFGDGVLQGEGWGLRADGEDAVFDAGGEELLDGGVGDGEALGLDELAGVGGDGVELILEGAGCGERRHLVLV